MCNFLLTLVDVLNGCIVSSTIMWHSTKALKQVFFTMIPTDITTSGLPSLFLRSFSEETPFASIVTDVVGCVVVNAELPHKRRTTPESERKHSDSTHKYLVMSQTHGQRECSGLLMDYIWSNLIRIFTLINSFESKVISFFSFLFSVVKSYFWSDNWNLSQQSFFQ